MSANRKLHDTQKINIPLRRALPLVFLYAKRKIGAQCKSVFFVAMYLALFQLFVLKMPIRDALEITAGVIVVAIGLAAFLEGLFIAIMPLGEQCGRHISGKMSFPVIILFSIVLGITATLAEPAIGFVQSQGVNVQPWRAPLLYFLLNSGAVYTVGAMAIGVGLAVMCGIFRFLYAVPLKLFIFTLIPSLLALTWIVAQDPRTVSMSGLAWDAGCVATGPVTVPLMLALGIGISSISGKRRTGGDGLGVVMLASATPVLMLLLLSLILRGQMPEPSSPEIFFSAENAPAAMRVLGIASESEYVSIANMAAHDPLAAIRQVTKQSSPTFLSNLLATMRAILPLSIILLCTLVFILREKVKLPDEVVLGIILSMVGLMFFNGGMQRGLHALGAQTGALLPKAYQAIPRYDQKEQFHNVDSSMIVRAMGDLGTVTEVLPVYRKNHLEHIPFDRAHYDASAKTYTYVPVDMPLWYRDGPLTGYLIILLFMFIMGLGVTVAEPLLYALGLQIEEMTGGAYRRGVLIFTVAIGVGLGVVSGFARILFDFPIVYLLFASYGLALVLTFLSDDEFTAIAWDCAGVTTGPITVPLVIATGMGIGSQAGVADSFGVIAAASAFPIITVLLSGFIIHFMNRPVYDKQEDRPDEIYTLLGEDS